MKKVFLFLCMFGSILLLSCNKDKSADYNLSMTAKESSIAKVGTEIDFSNAGEIITKEEAAKMTNDFRFEVSGIKAHTFSKQILLNLLYQDNIEAVRFYYGTENDKPVLVVCGVNKTGQDIGFYLERSDPCPPCGEPAN